MALETLGFVNDKTAIILDIGNAYTKLVYLYMNDNKVYYF